MNRLRGGWISGLLVPVLLLSACIGRADANAPVITTSQDRYLALGFDDLRESDFTTVWPILGQIDGARATFNKISESLECDANAEFLLAMEQELGDHTWYHQNYVFTDPLLNGQDPAHPEGDQVPWPTNDQMRADRGDGKNAFGYDLTEPCGAALSKTRVTGPSSMETPWGELSDRECQKLREAYSVMKDKSGLLETLDTLSNTYLGTSGSSAGSWDETRGCYAGGIFTGCRTSANHEIWERILEATQLHYQATYHQKPVTWSMPGGNRSAFFFTKDKKRYYDEECTLLVNFLAPMTSSLYTNPDGTPKVRSWVQVLRENGYLIAHDSMYPSRVDGTSLTMMSMQLIYNASLSRRDALVYRTNSSTSYKFMARDYPKTFFKKSSGKSKAEQMYDGGGSFRDFIEAIRMNTSNGMVHGEIIDSSDSYSFEQFFTAMMDYCTATGVQIVSKKDAYDICFEEDRTTGDNLIYNQGLVNTAKAFLPKAETVPEYPDGYQGDCSVTEEEGAPTLRVQGAAWYLHYGIPLGEIRFRATVRGEGSIRIYAIRNRDRTKYALNADGSHLILLAEGVAGSGEDDPFELVFTVPDNPETAYEQRWEGLGNKVMGIRIEYQGDLWVKDLCLSREN